MSLQTATPFIFLTLPRLMMRNQVFLELDSKNMDASVYTTFTPINFNVALLQDIQLSLNFEHQDWVPKYTQIYLYFQAAFKLQTLDFCFNFCKFSAQMCLTPACSASLVSEFLFLCLLVDNANMLSFLYIFLYLQLLVCSHSFCLPVCLFE